jgi:hypothetical protein
MDLPSVGASLWRGSLLRRSCSFFKVGGPLSGCYTAVLGHADRPSRYWRALCMGGVPMIRLIWCLLLLGFARASFAGYANVSPPTGFSTVNGAHFYTSPANAAFVNGTAAASVTANVGGRAVVVPAAMRLASNAGAFAVAAVRASPQTLVVGAVASWLLSHGLQWVNDEWRKAEAGFSWSSIGCIGQPYSVSQLAACGASTYTGGDCPALFASRFPTKTYMSSWQEGSYTVCWSSNDGGIRVQGIRTPTTIDRAANEADFLPPATAPLPVTVPPALPVPLPIDLPIVNPSPDPYPVPLPLRIPVGDPYPVPATDPQEYKQPIIDMYPRPTVAEPWRVDMRPGDITGTDPTGVPEPVSIPASGPAPSGTPTPAAAPGLCEQYPDIAACKPLGEAPASDELETRDVSADFSDRVTFGADTASCPAPRVMSTTLAGDLQLSWEGACMFADGIRPVVIALAYLAAAASFFGIGFARGD